MKYLPLTFTLLLFATVSFADKDTAFFWGKPMNATHDVSVAELLGRPKFFDGQPVRVTGVASINFEFEARSSVYLTRDDLRYDTQNRVDLFFKSDFSGPKDELSSLSHKYVVIEGVYRVIERKKYDSQDFLVVCPWGCPAGGYIEEISFVSELNL